MNNLLSVYDNQGNFDCNLCFTTLYGTIPCKQEYCISSEKDEIDEAYIKASVIKKFFTKIDLVKEFYSKQISEKSDFEENIFHPYNNGEEAFDVSGSLYVAGDRKIIYVNYTKCVIYYDYKDYSSEEISDLAEKVFKCFKKAEPESKTSKVGLIKVSQDDYYVSFSEINPGPINIEENYNDDFIPVYKDIKNFLESRGSGLILLWGTVGSGKTSLIRHLCTTYPKNYIIVPNGIATRLAEPELMSFIASRKDDVFILEDCEQLLVDRVNNPWNNAIATILNMSDGLLSDVVNIKFICTFNAGIDKIDSALLRKGRCFAKYEFKPLEEKKVEALNNKYNLGIKEIKPMTLAEIYNQDRTDYSEDTIHTKIGL